MKDKVFNLFKEMIEEVIESLDHKRSEFLHMRRNIYDDEQIAYYEGKSDGLDDAIEELRNLIKDD